MKAKVIIASFCITVVYLQGSLLFSQNFSGGTRDGYDATVSVNYIPQPLSMFNGGMGNGYSSTETRYLGFVLIGQFSGGNGDGAGACVSTNFIPQPLSPFGGGQGDGYAAVFSLFTGRSQDVSCFGGSDGEISLNPAAVWQPLTFQWSNGAITQNLHDLAAATYAVTVTDQGKNQVTASFTISQPPQLVLTPTFSNVNCFGGADGAINIVAAGGTPAYAFEWSTGETSSSLSGLTAGIYSVVITDSHQCTLDSTFNINQPAALPEAPVVQPVFSFCQFENASSLSATGSDLLWYSTPAGGTGSADPPVPPTLITGSTLYYVSQTVGQCESERSVTEALVYPVYSFSEAATICMGDSILLGGAYRHIAGTYYDTLNTQHACDSIRATDLSLIPCGSALVGWVKYKNAGNTPLKNATVFLKQGSTVVSETTTDNAGNYSFNFVPVGDYQLSAASAIPWGGVNSSDGLLILKHFTGLSLLTELNLVAADVDMTGYINAADALLAVKRFVGLQTSFTAGDWAFEKKNITISGPESQTQNLYGLCYGDVNGSYQISGRESPSIDLERKGETSVESDNILKISIKAGQDAAVNALSLIFDYPADILGVLSVIPSGSIGNSLCHAENGVLRIGWYDTEYVSLKKEEDIFTITFRVKSDIIMESFINRYSSDYLLLTGNSEVAGIDGHPLFGFKISIPRLTYKKHQEFSASVYPNPMKDEMTVDLVIPEEGSIFLKIFDMTGRLVQSAVNPTGIGNQQITFNSKGISSGSYYYVIDYQSVSGLLNRRTGKLVK
ncbi:MAG: carboxypeptidase regulatory-like domain-containing protein [Bacteroidetes bacterium]|nr:carboxypeptidase regulatory-like domain-containing protein [Bacteroidota bacterium]